MTDSRPRKRRVLRAIGITVLAIVVVLGTLRGVQELGSRLPVIEPTGPEVVRGELRVQPIRFTQDDFYVYPRRVDAELGTLVVPAIRGDATAGSVDIRWVRFATTVEEAAPPVVYLAGGPGGSGISTAAGDRFGFFMTLREAGDVIALAQRGTYHTETRPACGEEMSDPLDAATDTATLLQARRSWLEACWAEWEGKVHPAAFTTIESVEDLEAMRLALGAEQLNLVGISYGTHLALAYIRSYPGRVGRAVLAGIEGPDHTFKRPRVVDDIVREIDAALEREAGWDGFVEDIEAGVARLAAETPRVTVRAPRSGEDVTVTLGPADLKLAVYYGLGERDGFKRAARRVRQIAGGDYARLASLAVRIRRPGRPLVMPLSMDCASGVTEARRQQIDEETVDALIGDVVNLDLTTICPHWPVPDLGDDYRSPIRSEVPVLAISGTLDPRTPPGNAEEVLAGFPNGRHLRIVGGGHGDDLLIGSPRIADAMVRFLRDGNLERDRIEMPPL